MNKNWYLFWAFFSIVFGTLAIVTNSYFCAGIHVTCIVYNLTNYYKLINKNEE